MIRSAMIAPAVSSVFVGTLLFFGCGSSTATSTELPTEPDGGDNDASVDLTPDAGPDLCAELSIPKIPFSTAEGGTRFGALAGDFTVHDVNGESWHFAERWTGCESYVFFVNLPKYNDKLFETAPDMLLKSGPKNVHYFFLSDAADEAARTTFAKTMATRLEKAFSAKGVSKADKAWWSARFHFVTDRATQVGSVGAMLTDYLAYAKSASSVVDLGDRGKASPPRPTVFGIDRAQHWDSGDSLSQYVASTDNSILGMAAFLPHFYNYRAELEGRLANEPETTIVPIIPTTTTTQRLFTETVTLPDASALASFDTLDIDVVVDCREQNPFACSEWDRIANVHLCVDGAACAHRVEIGRWITPYWRRGRQHYLLEASPMLGLLRAGGPTTFFVSFGPEWERPTVWDVAVSLRLRKTGEQKASHAERAFIGGTFNADYNASQTAFTFTPPEGTKRVELVTLLTGHGQDESTNCAEWCDHRHTFTINGAALPTIRYDRDAIGSRYGCAERASLGVIPGQYGNWAQSRAYWCPGMAVQPIRTDVTSRVTVGKENTLSYAASYSTEASIPAGNGNIDLTTYVVYYR
ncbi:MAG TPA: peptide-N-glycosidase F-related protein [Labilithrix sp.]|nr:peptide-N-glycosidase F-related protein [Labilithrix sp.]